MDDYSEHGLIKAGEVLIDNKFVEAALAVGALCALYTVGKGVGKFFSNSKAEIKTNIETVNFGFGQTNQKK